MSRLVKCDFCYVNIRLDEAWTYLWPPTVFPAKYGTRELDDDGEWAACNDCHGLLQARDIKGLMKRSLAGDVVSQKVPQARQWKRYIFESLLALPLLELPYQGVPRVKPFDGQHRDGGMV